MFPNSILLGTFEGDAGASAEFTSATIQFFDGNATVPGVGNPAAVSPFATAPSSGDTTLDVDLSGNVESIHPYIRTYADAIIIDGDEYTITNWATDDTITVSPALSQDYTNGAGGDPVSLKFSDQVKFEGRVYDPSTFKLDSEFQRITTVDQYYAANVGHTTDTTFESQFDGKEFTIEGSSQTYTVTSIDRIFDADQSYEATIEITFTPNLSPYPLFGVRDITFGS